MITELEFENWKSFSRARLHIDPLTVIIGLNAAGKSNALDALLFLTRAASGLPLSTALQGDQTLSGIRGGLEWAAFNKLGRFALSVKISSVEERTEYVYRIECSVGPTSCDLLSESLQRLKYRKGRGDKRGKPDYVIHSFKTDACDPHAPSIIARLYNEKGGTRRPSLRTHSIIGQLVQQGLRAEIESGIREVTSALKGIFILDPIPAHMRDYSPLSESLNSDGSNIAGVIAALPERERTSLEKTLTKFAGQSKRLWRELVLDAANSSHRHEYIVRLVAYSQ